MKQLKRWIAAGAVVLGFAGLVSGSAVAADAAPVKASTSASAKDLVLKGDARCTRCHDETENYPVLSIGKTRHGTVADGRTPTCTVCHGESEKHLKGDPNGKERASPDIVFRKGVYTPSAVGAINSSCLTCHQGGKRTHWAGSAHESRDVACTSCHQLHTQHDRARDKQTQSEACFTCHKEQRAQVSRPSHHPIPEGKVACSDCHNPHGSTAPKLLVKDSVNQTCYECHMEKRGPFLHNHQPVTEDCSICHNPHGTTAPTLLKQRQPLLCQNCHNVSGHRTQFVQQLGDRSTTSTAIGAMGRGCLNCHTNIHGSNSTTSTTTGGRFRQ